MFFLAFLVCLSYVHASENGGYYVCDFDANGQCIFALSGNEPDSWTSLVEHTIDRSGENYKRKVVDSAGLQLSVTPKPWTNGDDVITSATDIAGDDWSYTLVAELVFPLRNKMMFSPADLVDENEWLKYTKAFTDCNIKMTTETYEEDGRTVTAAGTDDVWNYMKNPNGQDIHHYVLQYLEEGAIDLVCLATDFEMSRCDTMRELFSIESGTRCDCWFDAYEGMYGSAPVIDQLFTTCTAADEAEDETSTTTTTTTEQSQTGPFCCDGSIPNMSTSPPTCDDGSNAQPPSGSCPEETTTTSSPTSAPTSQPTPAPTTTTTESAPTSPFCCDGSDPDMSSRPPKCDDGSTAQPPTGSCDDDAHSNMSNCPMDTTSIRFPADGVYVCEGTSECGQDTQICSESEVAGLDVECSEEMSCTVCCDKADGETVDVMVEVKDLWGEVTYCNGEDCTTVAMETDNYWDAPKMVKTLESGEYSFTATMNPEDSTCPDVSGSTSEDSEVEAVCMKNQRIPMDRIERLKRQFQANGGDIVMEGDADYDLHSRNYDPTCPYVPYVVFLPATEEDVAAALSLIAEFDEKFSIGTSRINQSCFTMTLGALINLRNFMTMEVDEEKMCFTVGAGVIQFEAMNYFMENHPSKFVLTLWGMMGSMVGPSVGGGIQWFLSAKYGTMAENALEYTIVMGDGTVMTANDDENEDLFWLLRGGGLAPGVITQMKYRIHDIPEKVVAYNLDSFPSTYTYDGFKGAMSLWGQWFNALQDDDRFVDWAMFNFGFGAMAVCPGDNCNFDELAAMFPDEEFWNSGSIAPIFGEEGTDFWSFFKYLLVPFMMEDRHPSWYAEYSEGGLQDFTFTYEDMHRNHVYHDNLGDTNGYGNTGYWIEDWKEIYNDVDLFKECFDDTMTRQREPGTELWGCTAGFVFLGGIRKGVNTADMAWANKDHQIFIGVWNQGPRQKDLECAYNQKMLSTNTIRAGYFNYGNPCYAEESLYPMHSKTRLEEYRERYDPTSMFMDSMNYWVWKDLEYCQDMYHCSGNGMTSGLVADGCMCVCDEGYSGDMCEEMTTEEPSDDGCDCDMSEYVAIEDFDALRAEVRELQGSLGSVEADNNDVMNAMEEMATCMSGIVDGFSEEEYETEEPMTEAPDTTRMRSTTTTTATTMEPTKMPSPYPTMRMTEKWETMARMVEGHNKCGTGDTQRAFRLTFTSLDNCVDRCYGDSRCNFASTDMASYCIGCIVVDRTSDGWSAYEMMRGRRQLSEVETLRRENAALKAELARVRRN